MTELLLLPPQTAMEAMGLIAIIVNCYLIGQCGQLQRLFPWLSPEMAIISIVILIMFSLLSDSSEPKALPIRPSETQTQALLSSVGQQCLWLYAGRGAVGRVCLYLYYDMQKTILCLTFRLVHVTHCLVVNDWLLLY